MQTQFSFWDPRTLVPESCNSIVSHRINEKNFGCMRISAPEGQSFLGNLVVSILLDDSDSMNDQNKLSLAIQTILNFVEVMAERSNVWLCLVTFNSHAQIVIPVTQLTPEAMPGIVAKLKTIWAHGCTNYEQAFRLENQVLQDSLQKMPTDNPVHLVRIFLTDGEITKGSRDVKALYEMMREIKPGSIPELELSTRNVVCGFGSSVDLGCLQALSSLVHPVTGELNCSSLVTITSPKELGLKIGDIVYSIVYLFGANIQVSIDGNGCQIFDYHQQSGSPQGKASTQVWHPNIRFSSISHGDSINLWIETPLNANFEVSIRWNNPFSGQSHTHVCTHNIEPLSVPPSTFQEQFNLFSGMLKIDIFKMWMAAQNDAEPDLIVRNAYYIIRMLKELSDSISSENEQVSCVIKNLMTDACFTVGLMTVESQQEKEFALWDRQVCSGGDQLVNSGLNVTMRYVPGEERFEDEALKALQNQKPEEEQEQDDCFQDDCFHSEPIQRMASVVPSSHSKFQRLSKLRTLCAMMATARLNGDERSAESLLAEMNVWSFNRDYHDYPNDDGIFSSIPSDDHRRHRMSFIRRISSNPQRSDTSTSGGFDPVSPSKRFCSDQVASS